MGNYKLSFCGHPRVLVYIIGAVFILLPIILIVMYIRDNDFCFNSEFGEYLSGIFAPISALGSLFLTYYIYVATSARRRADDDFKQIAKIYSRILEGFERLKDEKGKGIVDDKTSFYNRQLKTDSILLLNLIRRFPSQNFEISPMEKILMSIYVNPNYESDYLKLTEEFQEFCYELNPNRNPNRFTIKTIENV